MPAESLSGKSGNDGTQPGSSDQRFEVIYRDSSMVVIEKPVGWLVHRTSIATDIRQFIVQELRNQLGQLVYPVHRLDRPTSGLLILALDPVIAKVLGEQFRSRSVEKRYLAIVRGFTDQRGRIEHPLKDSDDPRDRGISRVRERRAAVTEFERLHSSELSHAVGRYETARYSLLRLSPRTGRRHQIRRHLRHIAHPIVGDRSYGDRDHNRFFADHWSIERMLLAAHELRLRHPVSGETVSLRSPLDSGFLRALSVLNSPWADSADLGEFRG